MTVCIAAVTAEREPKIILCTDEKVSSSLGSSDTMLKIRSVGNFQCLVSGLDTDIFAVVRLLRRSLFSMPVVDETNLLPLIRMALNQLKQEKLEELTRGRFSISYQDFLLNGKTHFPENLFSSTLLDIERTGVDAECLICGFDKVGLAYIAQTYTDCRAALKEDFATIGEGAYLAQASLFNRRERNDSFEHTLYCVYEAKRFAEGAPSVGASTMMMVMYQDGHVRMVTKNGLAQLDEMYQKSGRQKISPTTIDIGNLYPPEFSGRSSAAPSAESK